MSVKWSEGQYGCCRAKVARLGDLSAQWAFDGGGYSANAFGNKLKGKFASIDEAKTAAEQVALKLVRDALAMLESKP